MARMKTCEVGDNDNGLIFRPVVLPLRAGGDDKESPALLQYVPRT